MTEDEYHARRTAERTLADIYQVVKSIEEKVEDILEEISEFVSNRGEDYRSYYPRDGFLEEF